MYYTVSLEFKCININNFTINDTFVFLMQTSVYLVSQQQSIQLKEHQ